MVDLLAARACCLLEWEEKVVRKARPTIDHDDRKLGVRCFSRSGFLIHLVEHVHIIHFHCVFHRRRKTLI
jgi:hypothetical protein